MYCTVFSFTGLSIRPNRSHPWLPVNEILPGTAFPGGNSKKMRGHSSFLTMAQKSRGINAAFHPDRVPLVFVYSAQRARN